MSVDPAMPPSEGMGALAAVLTEQRDIARPAGGANHPSADTALAAIGTSIGVRFPSVVGLVPTHGSLIKTAADLIGIRTHAVALPEGWWLTTTYPFVGFRGEGVEPVAILPRTARRWDWVDPSTGVHRPVDEEFRSSLRPGAMVFVRPLPEGPVTPRLLADFLVSVVRRPLTSVLIIGLFSALMGIVLPIASKMVFGQVLPSGQKSMLWAVVGLLGGAGAVTIALAYAESMAQLRVSGIMMSTLVPATWDRLLRLPASFFRAFSVGDLQSRMSGLEDLRTGLQAGLRAILACMSAAVAIVMMLIYSPALTLVPLVGLVVAIAIVVPLAIMRVRRMTRLMTLHGTVASVEFELFQAVPKLRVAAAEPRAFNAWADATASQLSVGWQLVRLSVIGIAAATVLPALIAAVIYAVAGSVLIESLSVGNFMGFTTAAGMLSASFAAIRKSLDEGMRTVPVYRRIKPIFTAEPEDAPDSIPLAIEGRIDLDDVTFRYEPDGPAVLDGVSLHAEPGEFVAITGTSGAGKSTIIRLLLGFESPESGTVMYDGSDLTRLSKSSIRSQIGTVNQRARAAAGSIASEILGDSGLPLDRAWTAAESAGIADDIRALPMQMHTILGEGASVFSGGQIQRMVIARAIVADPKVLLLDEATSALDNAVQASIGDALAALSATRIVIAHRLSTIRGADRIYVLDHGKVVQVGTYDELVGREGPFRTLAERQLLDPVT